MYVWLKKTDDVFVRVRINRVYNGIIEATYDRGDGHYQGMSRSFPYNSSDKFTIDNGNYYMSNDKSLQLRESYHILCEKIQTQQQLKISLFDIFLLYFYDGRFKRATTEEYSQEDKKFNLIHQIERSRYYNALQSHDTICCCCIF
jgi:hypothetical protein